MYKTLLMLLVLLALPVLAKTGHARTVYKDGTPCKCDSIHWEEAGEDAMESESPSVHGKIDGVIRQYGWSDGRLAGETPYVRGKPHGTSKTYYESGAVETAYQFVAGIQYGASYTYYEDGTTASVTIFNAGEQHGVSKMYYEDGMLRNETPWVHGREHGTATNYFKNGTVAGTTVYNNGQHMGTTCTDGRTGGPALDCTARKK